MSGMNPSDYMHTLVDVLEHSDFKSIDSAIAVIREGWLHGRQIITLGNGGSAMTALHYTTDWNKSVFMSTGKPFLGRSLVDNIGLVTAYGNDINYDDVFVAQLKNLLRPLDVVVAVSGSGNSENIIRAVDYCNKHDAITVGICGYRGGRLKNIAQYPVWVDKDDMQIVEDVHMVFGHMVLRALADYVCSSR